MSISPPIASRLSRRMQLRAAGQARLRAEHVLRAAGAGLRVDVLVGDEAVQVVRRPAALLDVGGDRADRRVAEVPHHPAQRARREDHVGVDDQHRLVPALGADAAQPVVERVRLALAAASRAAGGRPGPGTRRLRAHDARASRRCSRRRRRRRAAGRAGSRAPAACRSSARSPPPRSRPGRAPRRAARARAARVAVGRKRCSARERGLVAAGDQRQAPEQHEDRRGSHSSARTAAQRRCATGSSSLTDGRQ